MTKEPMFETAQKVEQALLVGVQGPTDEWPLEQSLAELESLVNTAGADVVGSVTQKLTRPNTRTLVGKGKVQEIATAVKALNADLVVFDAELTPTQQSNLESEIKGVKILDRTALILDIFALHANTREGRLQVRLAQNQYLLPRLRGMWAHLAANRMGGGVGSRFGEGESQLEVDRRMVRKRIDAIKQELAKVERERDTQRKARQNSGVYKVSLAGYTNAGKSSLLNSLTNANVLAYDKLFATLDSTTRKLILPEGREMTLTDTVGFIQKLPHTLVESFNSTLNEIRDADLILHVVDASTDQRDAQMQAVNDVLEQIDAHGIPQLLVFNKTDLLEAGEQQLLASRYTNALFVSARMASGTKELLQRIEQTANASATLLNLTIPFEKGALVQFAHQNGTVLSESYTDQGTTMQLRIPSIFAAKFVEFQN